jgi:hypothetical protein
MSRTYRNAPLSPSPRPVARRTALRDDAVVLRHRRRQAAADPVLGRSPASPGQWADRARAHLSAMESVFGEITHVLSRDDSSAGGLCACGQRQCDFDLARVDREVAY